MIEDHGEAIRIAREHMKRFGKWENVHPEVKLAYEHGFVNGLLCNTEYYQQDVLRTTTQSGKTE